VGWTEARENAPQKELSTVCCGARIAGLTRCHNRVSQHLTQVGVTHGCDIALGTTALWRAESRISVGLPLGRGLIIPDPDSGGDESNGRQEVSGELVEAGGDASEVLELVEEALDEVALPVEIGIDRSLDLDVALCGDMGLPTSGADQVDQRSRVVPAICDEGFGRRQGLDQARCHGLVGSLAGREQQSDRQSLFVDNGVDLGAQSSTRTANGVIRTPFLPPAACWWARTIELSMNCSDCGERAARASKMCSHTPALAQRL